MGDTLLAQGSCNRGLLVRRAILDRHTDPFAGRRGMHVRFVPLRPPLFPRTCSVLAGASMSMVPSKWSMRGVAATIVASIAVVRSFIMVKGLGGWAGGEEEGGRG